MEDYLEPVNFLFLEFDLVDMLKLYLALMQLLVSDCCTGKSLGFLLVCQLVFPLSHNNYYCHNHFLPQNNYVGSNFSWTRYC